MRINIVVTFDPKEQLTNTEQAVDLAKLFLPEVELEGNKCFLDFDTGHIKRLTFEVPCEKTPTR